MDGQWQLKPNGASSLSVVSINRLLWSVVAVGFAEPLQQLTEWSLSNKKRCNDSSTDDAATHSKILENLHVHYTRKWKKNEFYWKKLILEWHVYVLYNTIQQTKNRNVTIQSLRLTLTRTDINFMKISCEMMSSPALPVPTCLLVTCNGQNLTINFGSLSFAYCALWFTVAHDHTTKLDGVISTQIV